MFWRVISPCRKWHFAWNLWIACLYNCTHSVWVQSWAKVARVMNWLAHGGLPSICVSPTRELSSLPLQRSRLLVQGDKITSPSTQGVWCDCIKLIILAIALLSNVLVWMVLNAPVGLYPTSITVLSVWVFFFLLKRWIICNKTTTNYTMLGSGKQISIELFSQLPSINRILTYMTVLSWYVSFLWHCHNWSNPLCHITINYSGWMHCIMYIHSWQWHTHCATTYAYPILYIMVLWNVTTQSSAALHNIIHYIVLHINPWQYYILCQTVLWYARWCWSPKSLGVC